jgi:pimeloyl-ACP methyl ester carboxylesterase
MAAALAAAPAHQVTRLAGLARSGRAAQLPAATCGSLVLASLRDLPTQTYYRYIPADLRRAAAPVLVSVHGISRNAREHALACLPIAQKLGCALIAPLFSREFCQGYQQLGLTRGGRRADTLLDRIVAEVVAAADLEARPIYLFGFSGGAQFAHRYALLHPERVARLAVASAGWYTMPDPRLQFPEGMSLGEGARETPDVESFLAIPMLVSVGGQDLGRDRHVRSEPTLDASQGRTRLERAFTYVAEVSRAARRRALQPRVRLAVVAGAGHGFRECMRRGLSRTLLDWFTATNPFESPQAGYPNESQIPLIAPDAGRDCSFRSGMRRCGREQV